MSYEAANLNIFSYVNPHVNKISVSTLPMDMDNLELSLMKVRTSDYLHVDVMDGKFVEQETIWVDDVRRMKEKTDLVFDVHLMIENPENHVEAFIEAGADIVNFHVEAASDAVGLIRQIQDLGARAGVSVNPDTGFSEFEKLIPLMDQLMVMSVHPGEGGQDFIADVLEKVTKARDLREDLDIEVDGGVNEKTGEKCVDAGANILCSGSYVFGFDDPKIGIDILRNI